MYKQSFPKIIAILLTITVLFALAGSFFPANILTFAADGLIPPGQTPATPKPGGTPEPYITPAPVTPAEGVPLGIGTTFTLFSTDYTGINLSGTEGLKLNNDGGVVYSDGSGYVRGPYTFYNVSPVNSGHFGTADIVLSANAYLNKTSGNAVFRKIQALTSGKAMVVYKPRDAEWLNGVKTRLSVYMPVNNGLAAIVEHAGGTDTIPLDKSSLPTGHLLTIGEFDSVKSVSINMTTASSTYLPPVTFQIINDYNGANPNPVVEKRRYVHPQITAVPGTSTAPDPTPNPNIKIRINEICSENINGSSDGYDDKSDWIELYNADNTEIDISGWYISDAPKNNPGKCAFPTGTKIPAGGFLIVRASDKGGRTAVLKNGEYHVNFKIDKAGEAIGLINNTGVTVDFIDTPEIETDKTFSRYPDGSNEFRFTVPTLNAANINGEVYLIKPEMSYQSGFYQIPINVSITAVLGEGQTLRYTTDGTDPTMESDVFSAPINVVDRKNQPNVYSAIEYAPSPISSSKTKAPANPVDKATIIRAAVFDQNGNRSGIATKTYFIGRNISASYNNMPVISLVTDPYNLFDNGNGHTNPKQNTGTGIFTHSASTFYDDDKAKPQDFVPDPLGLGWERPVHVTMFESDGSIVFHQNAGIATRGLGSSTDDQKGMNIKASSSYGKGKFEYPLFGEKYQIDKVTPMMSYDSFALKQGGRMGKPKYVDPAVTRRSEDLDIGAVDSRSVVVFINGEFWGTYFMQERTVNDYMEENYGIDKNDAILHKGGKPKGTMTIAETTLMSNNKTSIMNAPNTAAGYQTLDTLLDIDRVMLYYAANINSCNIDWELAGFNYALWRSRTVTDTTYQDGKWRPLLNDLDAAYYPDAPNDTFNMNEYFNTSRSLWLTPILKNSSTKVRFANALFDVYNSSLEAHQVYDEMVYMKDELSATHPESKNRWGYNNLDTEIDGLYWRVVGRRPYMANLFKTNLGAQGILAPINVRVNDINGGTVKVNSIAPDFSNGSWGGFYLTDYTVKLLAQPYDGYEFKGWQASDGTVLSGQDALTYVTLNPNGSMVTAIFGPIDPNWTPTPSTPTPSPTPSPSPTPTTAPITSLYDDFTGWTVKPGTTEVAASDKAVAWESGSRLYDTSLNTWFGRYNRTLGGRSSGNNTLGMSYEGDFGGKMMYIGHLYHVSLGDRYSVIKDAIVDGYDAWDYHYAHLLNRLQIFAGPDANNLQPVEITHITGGPAPAGEVRNPSVGLIVDKLPANANYVKIKFDSTNWVDKFLFVDINNADKETVMASAVPVKGGTIISNINKKSTDQNHINAVTLLGDPADGMVILAKYKNELLTDVKLVRIAKSDFDGPIATALGLVPKDGLMTIGDGETYKAMFIESVEIMRPISDVKD